MSMDMNELQNIFEYELKSKLNQKCRTKNDEIRVLLNAFKFYDYSISPSSLLDKNNWIKGVLKTGLCGFNINDLSNLFNRYDIYNTGFIDYRNFVYYLYDREKLAPVTKNIIDNNKDLIDYQNTNRVKSPFIDFKPPGLYERNYQMLDLDNTLNLKTPNVNQYQEISKNNNNSNNNSPKNNIKIKQYYDMVQKQQAPNTPFSIYSNVKSNNNNMEENKNNLSVQNYSFSFEKDSYFHKLLLLLRSKINIDNGITYYTFAEKLKACENYRPGIDLISFYSSLRDINITFRLSDLTDLFNFIDNSKKDSVPSEDILRLIRGNLNNKRKNIIEFSYSLIDKDNRGRVPISILKSLYNYKLHPDVYVGVKPEEDIYKEFTYTFDLFCRLYNIYDYITLEQFTNYYWGISASIIDDNYFEDILNGVWNKKYKTNKNINAIINENLNINKNSNDNYKKELIGNKIFTKNNYFLNNRYVNSPDINLMDYNNNSNSTNNNKSQQNNFVSPYTPIPKENENNHERVTPYYHPQKTPLYKGVKTYRCLRHNPITNQYIMSIETPINEYYDSPLKRYYNNRMNYEEHKINKPIPELNKFKQKIMARGPKGIFIFQKLLCLYDKDKIGQISFTNFNELVEMFILYMTKQSIYLIFEYFDKTQNGFIKYDDLIKELVGNINYYRESLIKKLYEKHKNNDGVILINELKQSFKAFNHPYVRTNKKTEQEVYNDFIECIDIFKNYKSHINGYGPNVNEILNYLEFLELFKEISMSIRDDNLFEEYLINCWDIDKDNDAYNIYKNNELTSLQENNLRIRTANQILNNNGYNY